MSKKNKNKNLSSIAVKMNSEFVRGLFSKFIIIDIVFIASMIFLWCADIEMSFYGDISSTAKRTFDFYPMDKAVYTVLWHDGKSLSVEAYSILNNIRRVMIPILTIEGIFLFWKIIFGTSGIRKRMKPLSDLIETTDRLSHMTFDEDRVHNLEDAISNISPIKSNERVRIDDSDLKGLEDAINRLLDRMRESYREQARFVSDASHELRTPIAVIQGYANMLDRWGKNDESVLEESIKAIKCESESMKNLIEQLLFLARGINGKTQLIITRFSLDEMMNEVLDESKMIDTDHIYKYVGSIDVDIKGDRRLLKQTARILIDNAAKYTKSGEEIVLKSGKNEKGEAYFSIEDNGIGMNEKDVVHIFDRFFRADTSRTKEKGGTGLGLSIAKWIVDNHNGYFSVLSREGIGTRITVFLENKTG